MKEPVLVIMAAGIGSRYGGLKQTDPIGQNGELIIDYSVYDAKRAGFKKVIFIINHDIESIFVERIGRRISAYMEVEYAFQELIDIPEGTSIDPLRKKPLGTAHAIYTARKQIQGPFAVINADDFYGRKAFTSIYQFLIESSSSETEYAMVSYQLKNTVTEHGFVSRGVCEVDEDQYLVEIVERVHIERREAGIYYYEDEWNLLSEDQPVSMNMWGLKPSFVKEVEMLLPDFLIEVQMTDSLKKEFYLPYVVDEMIKKKKASVKVLDTDERWYGVTYQKDKEVIVQAMKELRENGIYPQKLWEENQ